MEAISIYTRQEALDDGVLSDIWVNQCAKELGIKWHCACTASLHVELAKSNNQPHESFFNMLLLFRQFILVPAKKENKLLSPGMTWEFKMSIGNKEKIIKVICSEEILNDEEEMVPCWTFMNTSEN